MCTEVIDLSVNIDLEGTIPTEFVALTNLKIFNVENCNLNGPLPKFDFESSLLEELSLSNNKLTGTIPDEYGNLTNLKRLVLDENEGLSGSISSESFTQLDTLGTTVNWHVLNVHYLLHDFMIVDILSQSPQHFLPSSLSSLYLSLFYPP